MCSGAEEGSYLRLIDFVYHSTLGLRVIKKKKGRAPWPVFLVGALESHTYMNTYMQAGSQGEIYAYI